MMETDPIRSVFRLLPAREEVEAGRVSNLPVPLTTLVGREREIAAARRMLRRQETRLLTLTGPGGVGKTRLGIQVAFEMAGEEFPDGVHFVSLAAIPGPELVVSTIARALELEELGGRNLEERLKAHLREKRLLLLLDNFEHVVRAAPDVCELLVACPHLKALVTSRSALHVSGEHEFPVPALRLPQERAKVKDLGSYESVALFVARARAVRPDFDLDEDDAVAVAEICARLDGLPLAIELAASRVRLLPPKVLLEKLDNRLLTGGALDLPERQRTLKNAIEWSYDLLEDEEQRLFRRLSVFTGRFTLDGAQAVGGVGEDRMLDVAASLVDKNLLRLLEGPGEPRLAMLRTIREYALQRLVKSGEEEKEARRAHAAYYAALAEEAEPELAGPRQAAWLARLEAEYGNLSTALGWCFAEEGAREDAEVGLRLAGALGRFWSMHRPDKGRRWLEQGIEKAGSSPGSLRAKALLEAGLIAVYQRDPGAAELLEEALTLYKKAKDRPGTAAAISSLGHAVVHFGLRERMRTWRAEVEALLEEPLERREAASLLLSLGMVAQTERDHERVRGFVEEALALFRELGEIRGVTICLLTLGVEALVQGESARASGLHEEVLRFQRDLKDKIGVFYGLMGMAAVDALQGRPARAARLWGAAEALRENIGQRPLPLESTHYDYEGYLAVARARLNEETWTAAWEEGRKMSLEESLEHALQQPDEPGEAEPPHAGPAGMTAREVEVLRLVAGGMTNAQVAEKLFISSRTVNAHLGSIYGKIGCNSRAGATRFAVENGLV